MSDIVIRAEGLGKRYRRGVTGPPETLRDALTRVIGSPLAAMRITRPTTGRAEIHGRVRSLLEVGTGFHWKLTGRENTYLSGSILGMGKTGDPSKESQTGAA